MTAICALLKNGFDEDIVRRKDFKMLTKLSEERELHDLTRYYCFD